MASGDQTLLPDRSTEIESLDGSHLTTLPKNASSKPLKEMNIVILVPYVCRSQCASKKRAYIKTPKKKWSSANKTGRQPEEVPT